MKCLKPTNTAFCADYSLQNQQQVRGGCILTSESYPETEPRANMITLTSGLQRGAFNGSVWLSPP